LGGCTTAAAAAAAARSSPPQLFFLFEMNPKLDFHSDQFDAHLALFAPRSQVDVPRNVKPFEHLERCRFLLDSSDPNYLKPPTRKRKPSTSVEENTSKMRRWAEKQKIELAASQQNLKAEQSTLNNNNSSNIHTNTNNDDNSNIIKNSFETTTPNENDATTKIIDLSKASLLSKMMMPLTYGRFEVFCTSRKSSKPVK
jgi:hypothetical protein